MKDHDIIGKTKLLSLITLVLLLASIPTLAGNSYSINEVTLYLLDYAFMIKINNTKAAFEMPINYSDGNYNQTVYIVKVGGNAYINKSGSNYYVDINMNNLTDAFFIAKIVIRYRNVTSFISKVLQNHAAYSGTYVIPSNILTKYVKKPVKIIKEKVVPDYIKWLRNTYGESVKDISKAFIAVTAAQFIYRSGYIRYSPSPYPRTVEEIVTKHEGDCDDMSRVLMNLLWYFGIPARIEYGYVYLPLDMPVPVGNSLMYFKDAGPHGYVIAYIPPLGWVSLDFLANARLSYLVVVTGHDSTPDVSKKAVKEAEEFNIVNVYTELIQLFGSKDLSKLKIDPSNTSSIRYYALSKLHPYLSSRIKRFLCNYLTTTSCPLVLTETKTVTKTVTKVVTKTLSRSKLPKVTTTTVTSISTKIIEKTTVLVKTRTITKTTVTTSIITKSVTGSLSPKGGTGTSVTKVIKGASDYIIPVTIAIASVALAIITLIIMRYLSKKHVVT